MRSMKRRNDSKRSTLRCGKRRKRRTSSNSRTKSTVRIKKDKSCYFSNKKPQSKLGWLKKKHKKLAKQSKLLGRKMRINSAIKCQKLGLRVKSSFNPLSQRSRALLLRQLDFSVRQTDQLKRLPKSSHKLQLSQLHQLSREASLKNSHQQLQKQIV